MNNVIEIVLIGDQEITQVRRQNEKVEDLNGLGSNLIVTLDNGLKYLGCLVAIEDLKNFFNQKDNMNSHYWCGHLIVVRNMNMATIKQLLNEMLDQSTFSKAFEKIN